MSRSLSDAQLTPGQFKRKKAIQDSPYTHSFQLIEIGHLPTLQQNGFIKLIIPDLTLGEHGSNTISILGSGGNTGSGTISINDPNWGSVTQYQDLLNYEFQGKYVQSSSNGNYSWHGNLIGTYCDGVEGAEEDCFYGIFSLIKIGTRIFGELVLNDNVYHIKDLTGGLSALVKLNNAVYDNQSCGMDGSEQLSSTPISSNLGDNTTIQNSKGKDEATEEKMNSPCVVKALVCYTEAALEEHPDVEDVIALAIEKMSVILNNSEVSSDLVIELAGIVALTDEEFTTTENLISDAEDLPDNNHLNMNGYRKDYKADIVLIMVPDVYSEFFGATTAFGVDETFADKAYGIIEIPGANSPVYTFAHEIAHLFDARHTLIDENTEEEGKCRADQGADNRGRAYAHAHWFEKGCNCLLIRKKRFHSIMSTCPSGKTIEHFSNPDIKFKNKKTGIEGERDNARLLREETCRVARYVVTEDPSVRIVGPSKVCPEDVQVYYAEIQNVPPPFQISWRISDDGFNWSPPLISPFFEVTVPSQDGAIFFIELTAGNVNGFTKTITKSIEVVDSEEICFLLRPDDLVDNRTQSSNLGIFPNPANDVLHLNLTHSDLETTKVCIFDILGKKVHQFLTNADHNDIDISNLASGCYWMTVQSKGYYQSKSFLISR